MHLSACGRCGGKKGFWPDRRYSDQLLSQVLETIFAGFSIPAALLCNSRQTAPHMYARTVGPVFVALAPVRSSCCRERPLRGASRWPDPLADAKVVAADRCDRAAAS